MAENQSPPMDIEEATKRILKKKESASVLVNAEDSTGIDVDFIPMEIDEVTSRLLTTDESGTILVNVEESMNIDETESTLMEVEDASSRLLGTEESGSMLVNEDSTGINESTPMDIDEPAFGWGDQDDGFEREVAFEFYFFFH